MALFDLIQSAMGRPDPSMAIAHALGQAPGQPGSPQGPQPLAGAAPPGPPAGQGGAPGASDAPPGPPAAPQPQATQTPPDLGQMFVQLMQRQQASEGFNRGLGMLAAGFAQPRDRAAMIDAMSGQSGDPGSTMGNLMKLQQWNIQQQRMGEMQKNLPAIAEAMGLPLAAVQTMYASNPETFGSEIAKIQEAQMGLTGTQIDKEYKQQVKQFQDANPGKPLPAELQSEGAWDQNQREAITTRNVAAKDAQTFKDSAVEDFSSVDSKFAKNEKTVGDLLKNMPATMSALQAPDFLTTGKLPGFLPGGGPYDQSVKNAAIAMNTLKAELSGEGLRNVKNVRNVREFNTLASALTSALDPSNSPDQVQQALQDIQKRFIDAHATAAMAAGKQLTGPLVGRGDRSLLDRNNRYYNGATEEEPADGGGGGAPAGGGGGSSEAPPAPNAKKAADGKWYVPDPARPGKYLRVD